MPDVATLQALILHHYRPGPPTPLISMEDARPGKPSFIIFTSCALLLMLTVLAPVAVQCRPAAASQFHCDIAGISIEAPMPNDSVTACEGVRDALAFLKRQGVDAPAAIQLRIVEVLPLQANSSAVGIYLADEKRAYVLAYSEVAKRGTLFDLPPSRSLYRSLITHEVVHALAAPLFKEPQPLIEAQEYIAYVAMLAMMENGDRARILQMFPREDFEMESQINTFIYLFDPLRFGAQSYRHYLRPANGPGFIRRILSGNALNHDYSR